MDEPPGKTLHPKVKMLTSPARCLWPTMTKRLHNTSQSVGPPLKVRLSLEQSEGSNSDPQLVTFYITHRRTPLHCIRCRLEHFLSSEPLHTDSPITSNTAKANSSIFAVIRNMIDTTPNFQNGVVISNLFFFFCTSYQFHVNHSSVHGET